MTVRGEMISRFEEFEGERNDPDPMLDGSKSRVASAWRTPMRIGSASPISFGVPGVAASLVTKGQNETEQQEVQGIDRLRSDDPSVSDTILSIVHASHASLTVKLVNNLHAAKDPRADDMATWVENKQAAEVAANSMTSQQISAALYSGAGIAQANGGKNATMQDSIMGSWQSIANDRKMIADMQAWEAGGMVGNDDFARIFTTDKTKVDAHIKEMSDRADAAQRTESGIAAAFADHTLTFQKATDVEGLDYSQTFYDSYSQATETGGYTEHYNTDFYSQLDLGKVGKDGKHHALASDMTGGLVMLYLSW